MILEMNILPDEQIIYPIVYDKNYQRNETAICPKEVRLTQTGRNYKKKEKLIRKPGKRSERDVYQHWLLASCHTISAVIRLRLRTRGLGPCTSVEAWT